MKKRYAPKSSLLNLKTFLLLTSLVVGLLLMTGFFGFFPFFPPQKVSAVNCASVPISGNYTVSSSCSFANTVDGVDTGTGSSNTAVLTVGSGVTLTILAGQTIAAGSITNNGTITMVDTGVLKANTPIYVSGTDADADGYTTNTTQATTGTVRRNTMTDISQTDCYDGNANAKPGQTAYYTTNRGDGSFDYDCNGTADKQDTTTFTCSACTNGSGYASYQATSGGWTTSGGPACGVSENYYSVSNGACMDPAVADCSTMVSEAAQTMACR